MVSGTAECPLSSDSDALKETATSSDAYEDGELIDGVRYHKDRPASCRQCYFWKNRKAGCTLGEENCYYVWY